MKIKDKHSVFLLFIAMLASSLIIGSYCQTKFTPVEKLSKSEQLNSLKGDKSMGKLEDKESVSP